MSDEVSGERRRELDRDISSYISTLRRREKGALLSFLKKLKRKPKKDVELHPEVSTYDEQGKEEKKKSKEELEKEEKETEEEFEEGAQKKTFLEWLKSLFVFEKKPDESLEEAGERREEEEKAEEEKAEEELEEEYQEEVKKESWISNLIAKIFVKSREEEELEEASDELAEDFQDMKTIAAISTKVMKMLPPEKMKEFKEGEDFAKFKEILRKRELIK